MRFTLSTLLIGAGLTFAYPAENLGVVTTTSKTSTCPAASSVIAAVSSCGGTKYCSSYLAPITTTITTSATAIGSTPTVTKTVTISSTTATVYTKRTTLTTIVSTTYATKTSTVYTSTTTVTSTQTSQICTPTSTSKARRNIAASSTSTCSVTYPAASISAACSCLSVSPSTVTSTSTVTPGATTFTKTVTVTARATSSTTTTVVSTVKQTKTSTTTKTTSTVSTTTAIVTFTPHGFPTFTLQASGSKTGADSLYVLISSGSTQFTSSASSADSFVLSNNGSLLPLNYPTDYASAYNFEMNSVLFGSPDYSGTEAILACQVDAATCGFSCTDDAQENYAQTEFCVNQDAQDGVFYLYFGQCSYFSGENYPEVYLNVVPGPVISVPGS